MTRAMPRKAAAPAASYAQRLDRVLDYIADHLDGELSLAKLARVAGFSPFHFHRLFQAHVGETVHDHVRRVRVERAASTMRASPRRPLTEIALDVGFPALSDLSRAFKARFGIAPSRWNRDEPLPASKYDRGDERAGRVELAAKAAAAGLRVTTGELPASVFVYRRVFDPYGSQRLVDAYHAIRAWVGDRVDGVVFAGMSIDDPAVTPKERCRYDLGVLFPLIQGRRAGTVYSHIEKLRNNPGALAGGGVPGPAEVSRAQLSARRFSPQTLATVHCDGDIGHVDLVWKWLYRCWLPEQHRLPANQPAMELFVQLPEHIGWERFDLLACVPLA
jgi:AraC family transcriptional regulator